METILAQLLFHNNLSMSQGSILLTDLGLDFHNGESWGKCSVCGQTMYFC